MSRHRDQRKNEVNSTKIWRVSSNVQNVNGFELFLGTILCKLDDITMTSINYMPHYIFINGDNLWGLAG